MKVIYQIIVLCLLVTACSKRTPSSESAAKAGDTSFYASEIIDFKPFEKNPVFKGTGTDTWDQMIRERGYIIREDGLYHLWYTGYKEGSDAEMHLGYATSEDGLEWKRYADNPIFDSGWVEDMMVIKSDSIYYMFAEGRNDVAHLLTSTDRITWKEQGALDIRYVNGTPLSKGSYGTPTVWHEGDVWYLFYERDDLGIWLATSTDLKVWTNKQDEPILEPGPEAYDKFGFAVNQIVKHNGKYYAYYHGTEYKDWHEWSSCVALSEDLIHWKKYEKNPILRDNKSSPILVNDGTEYRLYTMHPEVCVHYPSK